MNPFNFITAFSRGKQLANIETWKRVSWTSGSISIIIKVIIYLLPMLGVDVSADITDGTITTIADGLANALSGLAIILIPATTTKIGILPTIKEIK